jgi:hypothetical protein
MDVALKDQAIDVIINESAALDHRQWDDGLIYTRKMRLIGCQHGLMSII